MMQDTAGKVKEKTVFWSYLEEAKGIRHVQQRENKKHKH